MNRTVVAKAHGITAIAGDRTLVADANVTVHAGHVHCLMGPSGSGKSTVARTFLGESGRGVTVTGDVWTAGAVGFVPQDYAACLNPVRRIGGVLREIHRATLRQGRSPMGVAEVLDAVGLPPLAEVGRRYPHQLSGGQQQRLVFAHAVLTDPVMIVADEPTSALDSVSTARVAELMATLSGLQVGLLVLTHDEPLAAHIADTTTRLPGPQRAQITWPSGRHQHGESGTAAVHVVDLTATYPGMTTPAVNTANLRVHAGECVGLVGASGSGKSTLVRAIAGLHTRYDGDVSCAGTVLPRSLSNRDRAQKSAIQYVFQDPRAAFTPTVPVLQQVRLPAVHLLRHSTADATDAATELLQQVGLSRQVAHQPAWRLSGGELQRAGLVRALITQPKVLLCDEVTSSLDPAATDDVLQVLAALTDTAIVLVSHQMHVIRQITARVMVLAAGDVVEEGATHAVLANPQHQATGQLVAAEHHQPLDNEGSTA